MFSFINFKYFVQPSAGRGFAAKRESLISNKRNVSSSAALNPSFLKVRLKEISEAIISLRCERQALARLSGSTLQSSHENSHALSCEGRFRCGIIHSAAAQLNFAPSRGASSVTRRCITGALHPPFFTLFLGKYVGLVHAIQHGFHE